MYTQHSEEKLFSDFEVKHSFGFGFTDFAFCGGFVLTWKMVFMLIYV